MIGYGLEVKERQQKAPNKFVLRWRFLPSLLRKEGSEAGFGPDGNSQGCVCLPERQRGARAAAGAEQRRGGPLAAARGTAGQRSRGDPAAFGLLLRPSK